MTLQYLAGNIITGLSTDTKPTSHVLDNTIFYETNTFKLYQWNGVDWIGEESTAETWTNKSLDAEQNIFVNCLVSPFAQSSKRVGIMTPAITSYGSLYGAIGGLTTHTIESYGVAYADSQEGNVIQYRQASGNRMGLGSTPDSPLTTRRAYNPRLKVRTRLGDLASGRLYIGFASVPEIPLTDTPLTSEDSGFIVGFSTTTPNFIAWTNDATGTAVTTEFAAGIAKDTNWHTYEIVMSAVDIRATLDDLYTVTMINWLPVLDTDLYMFIEGEVT